jgi:unsaturated rhamnogalacturonyl hydrolase
MIFRFPERVSGQRSATALRFVGVAAPALAFLFGCANKPAAEEVARQQLARAEAAPEKVADVELSNPSAFVRADSPVYLSYYDLGLPQGDARVARLAGLVGGVVVPSQHVD